jgi:adenine-specific DNA methylase
MGAYAVSDLENALPNLAPSTRYQGSKRRILPWLHRIFKGLEFETCLDGFGGTASVSYLLKLMGKHVAFNDYLRANYQTGIAIIENDRTTLDQSDLDFLLGDNDLEYESFIQDTFKNIYYTSRENAWLDRTTCNIQMLSQLYRGDILRKKRALAYHALCQACLCKRPFNLFHRKNLYLRRGKVDRTFGNKTTWDTDFTALFIRFAEEASSKVFGNGRKNRATCKDIAAVRNDGFDLVYLDPPYTRPGEEYAVDYFGLYHFLEGIADYPNWRTRIDWSTPNRRLKYRGRKIRVVSSEESFRELFEQFQDSVIAVSYGHPGSPSVPRIRRLLRRFKPKVEVFKKAHNYSLSNRNGEGTYEVLIVGR